VMAELITTGHVDTGNGVSSQFELALTAQEVERVLTGRAILNEPRQKPVCVCETTARRLPTGQTALVIDETLVDGECYRVVVYTLRVTPPLPNS
jgi:hypothetical protein